MGSDVLWKYVGKVWSSKQLTANGAAFSAGRQIFVAFAGEQHERLQPMDCILVTHPVRPVCCDHMSRLRVETVHFQPRVRAWFNGCIEDRSTCSGLSALGQNAPTLK